MDLGLKDKRAVVFASSQGIGRSIAMHLAQEGASVAICARGEEELQNTEKEIRDAGGDVLALPCDCRKPDDIKRLIEATVQRWGTVHVLVTNAGGPPGVTIEEVTEELLQLTLEQNLLSAIRMCREAIPYMKEQRWGRIIHITSITVKEPVLDNVLSNISRPGVVALSKTLAMQYAKYNITSNNLAIGAIWTRRSQTWAQREAKREGISVEEFIDRFAKSLPSQRLGRPEEVGALAAYLASEQAGYVTGQNISIDGGKLKGIL